MEKVLQRILLEFARYMIAEKVVHEWLHEMAEDREERESRKEWAVMCTLPARDTLGNKKFSVANRVESLRIGTRAIKDIGGTWKSARGNIETEVREQLGDIPEPSLRLITDIILIRQLNGVGAAEAATVDVLTCLRISPESKTTIKPTEIVATLLTEPELHLSEHDAETTVHQPERVEATAGEHFED